MPPEPPDPPGATNAAGLPDAGAPVALCVLRCEPGPHGVLVTLTLTPDVGGPATAVERLRTLHGVRVLEEVERFLERAGVDRGDAPAG